MRLSKADRDEIRMKFGGCCAYCGEPLGDRWHADHHEAVVRDLKWESGKGFRPTGALLRPQHDTLANLFPSCAPCNIDKGPNSLEWWREKLQGACGVLTRNNPTYRHALRFGLVRETGTAVVFHFERLALNASRSHAIGAAPVAQAVNTEFSVTADSRVAASDKEDAAQ